MPLFPPALPTGGLATKATIALKQCFRGSFPVLLIDRATFRVLVSRLAPSGTAQNKFVGMKIAKIASALIVLMR